MADFIKLCYEYGLNVPLIIGFLVASALAIQPGNYWVSSLHHQQLRKLLDPDRNKTLKQIDDEYAAIVGQFDMKFAALIGKTERILYVYSVMLSQFSVLSGWLVLKTFFGWLRTPKEDRSKSLPFYHLYLFGNALSLIAGLIFGALGIFIQSLIKRYIGIT